MTFWQTIWLFLPAALANVAPVLFKRLPFFDYPISIALFGSHKTYRGIIAGIFLALLTVYLQHFGQPSLPVLKAGLALGMGALCGDLIKSFFKRRVGIPPGKPWIPFDQIDWIVGAVIAVSAAVAPIPWLQALLVIAVYGALHPVVNTIGYYVGVQNNKI